MKPIPFVGSNHTLSALRHDEEKMMDVPAYVGKDAIASCWSVSDEEIEQIKATGCVWVIAKGDIWPAIALSAERPLKEPADYDFPDEIDES